MKKKITKKASPKKTVTIIYHSLKKEPVQDYYSKENRKIDTDTLSTVLIVRKALEQSGFTVQTLPLSTAHIHNLKRIRAKYVFNLIDSKKLEIRMTALLERLKIPFSGSSSVALHISNSKIRMKSILEKNGIPTPPYSVIDRKAKITRYLLPSKFPVIVKPAFEHGSVGVVTESVVSTYKQFRVRVRELREDFKQTLLCERFIKGEEIHVTVMESPGQTVALPLAEMSMKKNVKMNKWNIYGFTEKWNRRSKIYKSLHFVAPTKSLPQHIAHAIKRDAIRAFYALGFSDFARFDVRYQKSKKLWYFVDANANPGISNDTEDAMTASIDAYGMTLSEFLTTVIRNKLH